MSGLLYISAAVPVRFLSCGELLVFGCRKKKKESSVSAAVPSPLPFSLSSPNSDIPLTHNCGGPPPIAGINPHLRPPPPQTRCLLSHNAPQLQNFSQTHSAPLSTAHLSLPLEPPFLSAGLPARLFVVQFHLLCLFSFSNSLHFPFLRLHSASAFPTKVSPDLPRSPFDVKWRQRKRTNWRSSLRCWRAAVGPRVAFMRFYI